MFPYSLDPAWHTKTKLGKDEDDYRMGFWKLLNIKHIKPEKGDIGISFPEVRMLTFPGIVFFIMILSSSMTEASVPEKEDQRYRQALEVARAGRPERALPVLKRLAGRFPQVKRYRYDYIQVLLWAGHDQEVIRQSRKTEINSTPDYVLESVARAARNTKRFSHSENLYRQLIRRHPDSLPFQLSLARVLIDQDKMLAAAALLKKLKQYFPLNKEIDEVQQYADQHTVELRHQAALQLARGGKMKESLDVLSELMKQFPQNKRFFYDYILVLQWAGKDRQVLDRSQQLNIDRVPDYVLLSIARSARNLKQFTRAELLFRKLLDHEPADIAFNLGLAGVLIDQKKTVAARRILNRLQKDHPDTIDILLIQAYAEESDNDYLAAAMIYQRILHLRPGDRAAVRGLVFALSADQAFNLAIQKAEQNKSFFSDEEWVKLNWDLAAAYVRWGEIPSKLKENRYVETDRAIALIEKNLKMLASVKLKNRALWRSRAFFDLMVALRDRKSMQRVRALYLQLTGAGVEVPAYARIAAADAFLYLEQPEQARDLYLDVLKEIPNSYNASQSLVYAYVESEQLALANQLVRQMARQQPEKLWFKSTKGKGILYSRGNPRKTETELATAVITAFSDRLEEAQKRVDFLYWNASFNPEIRSARANIYYFRGWPRQARKQIISALNIEPEHLGLKTGLSRVLHELREFPLEQQNTEALYQQYPEDKGVQRQQQLWDIHNLRELRVFFNGWKSTGGTLGNETFSLDSLLFSQPLNYNYRVFTHFRWQTGNFVEGRGYFRRYGLGLEYAVPDLLATAEVHYDNFDKTTVGFQANVNYQFDDHWAAVLDVDTRSDDISLRALKNGVTAIGQQLTVSYRFHESRQVSVNQQYYNYSDNNNRYALSGSYYERWYSGPVYKFSTYLNAGYSHNTETNVPYYSPANDLSASLTLDNDILTYRYYDLSFNQRIAATIGEYWQDGVGSNLVGQILYEHRWKASNKYELVYGGIRGYPVYDGIREETWQFYLTLNMRF